MSRRVTRRCLVCGGVLKGRRRDARYCSGRCRQAASRARAHTDDIDKAIECARLLYWSLIRRKALALGISEGAALTAEAVTVRDGHVYRGGIGSGECIGQTTTAGRPGWTTWGIEAAGAPYTPPLNPEKDIAAMAGAPADGLVDRFYAMLDMPES